MKRIKLLLAGTSLNLCSIEAGMEENITDTAALPVLEAPTEDPKNCFDGVEVAKQFLPRINWDKAETRGETGREYKTTTAHNITLNDDKYSYQFGLSCNRKTKKGATPQGMTASESRKLEEARKIMTQVAKRTNKSVEDIALDVLGNLR